MRDIESFRMYCLSKPGVEEGFPFGEDTLVFKVLGKMFALTGLSSPDFKVNLKCDPEWAVELREAYPDEILPGFHMSKKHWNTVLFDRHLREDLLCQMVDHSYALVVAKLPAKQRESLQKMGE